MNISIRGLFGYGKEALSANKLILTIIFINWFFATFIVSHTYATHLYGFVIGGLLSLSALFVFRFTEGTKFCENYLAVVLMLFSALFIQQQLGKIEFHFYIFVVLAFLTVYKSISSIIYAAATSIVHHALFNLLQANNVSINEIPIMVFNYGCGWDIVFLHGFFVFIESIALIQIVRFLSAQDVLLEQANRELEVTNANLVATLKENKISSKQAMEFSNTIDRSLIVSKSDPKGIITYVNESFCDVSGYTEDELLGQPHNIVRHPDVPKEVFKTLWETILNKKIFKALIKNKAKDGSAYYVDTVINPILDIDGNIVEFISIRYDVTELILAQEKQLKHEEEKRVQMGELIGMVAHQWRQPLNLLGLQIQKLHYLHKKNMISEDTMEKNVQKMINSIEQMSTTIDDFRNFYKPDKKTVTTDLQNVLEKVLTLIEDDLEKQGVKITKVYDEVTTLELYESEVVQVVLNIIKNALDNFTEREIINPTLNITVNGKNILICDNGGGIPTEILNKIFDPYFSTKSEQNGTGLGLYMSKIIIEDHHDGKLLVENTDDGACFTIKLG